jgi:hypothetical protein
MGCADYLYPTRGCLSIISDRSSRLFKQVFQENRLQLWMQVGFRLLDQEDG